MNILVKRVFVRLLGLVQMLALLQFLMSSANAEEIDPVNKKHEAHHSAHEHNHSDDLLTLLGYKIKLQKLQFEYVNNSSNLDQQRRLLQRAMPVLSAYMATPKSHYLTTAMYHDSLGNRAAILSDFADILVKYQKQLVSMP